MKVYISYTKAQFVIHTNSNCNDIKQEAKENERIVIVTSDNLIDVLQLFMKQNWKFSNNKNKEDLWLDITLKDHKLEESFLYMIRYILSSYYKPFVQSQIIFHC
jgi:hypothetical protein